MAHGFYRMLQSSCYRSGSRVMIFLGFALIVLGVLLLIFCVPLRAYLALLGVALIVLGILLIRK